MGQWLARQVGLGGGAQTAAPLFCRVFGVWFASVIRMFCVWYPSRQVLRNACLVPEIPRPWLTSRGGPKPPCCARPAPRRAQCAHPCRAQRWGGSYCRRYRARPPLGSGGGPVTVLPPHLARPPIPLYQPPHDPSSHPARRFNAQSAPCRPDMAAGGRACGFSVSASGRG